jgi:hypothetical protein
MGSTATSEASELKTNRAGKTLLILLPALILPFVVLFLGDSNPIERDFAVLYVSGQTVLHSPETLFNVKSHTERTAAFAAQYNASLVHSATLWLYPAVTAWLYALLTMLPFPTAYWVMTAASLIALSSISYFMAGLLSARDCRFLGLCMLASPAIAGTILHGQTAIFTLLLITLAMYDKSDTRRGLWVGLLALKPLFVLQMMGWLALKKQWRALGLAAGISLFLAIASIVTTGIPGFLEHIALLRAVAAHSFNTAEINTQPTLSGLSMLLGIGWIGWAAFAIPVVVLVVANRNNPDFDAITLLGAVLIAPYMHNTEAGMIMLLIVATMVARGSGRIVPVGLLLAAGWTANVSLLAAVPLLFVGFFYLALRPYFQREIASA